MALTAGGGGHGSALPGPFGFLPLGPAACVAAEPAGAAPASPDERAIRASVDRFLDAYRKGDAKALAALWTESGEYLNDEGLVIRGRAELERSYAEHFKQGVPATIEVHIDEIRFPSKDSAVEEGTFSVTQKEDGAPVVSRYSALHVRENGTWRMALLKEWAAELAATDNPIERLAWLEGKWSATTKHGELRLEYAWTDENRLFLENRFTVLQDGKVVLKGTQVIGRDPQIGDLRSWTFDSQGSTADATWVWDGQKWLIDSVQHTVARGEMVASNILTPVDRDSFTWQAVAGHPELALDAGTPLKMTRVKTAR